MLYTKDKGERKEVGGLSPGGAYYFTDSQDDEWRIFGSGKRWKAVNGNRKMKFSSLEEMLKELKQR